MIAVQLREVLGHFALPEGIIERVVDERRLDAEAGRLVAVDHQRELGAAVLLVGGHIAQLRQFLELLQQPRRPAVELLQVGILQRVLILGPRQAPPDVQVLRGLQVQGAAGDRGDFLAQTVDDLVGGCIALLARLESQDHEAVVQRPAAADEGGPAGHPRVLGHDVRQPALQAHHLVEGDVLGRIAESCDDAGVLLREEALGHPHVHQHRDRHRDQEGGEGGKLVLEHVVEAARVVLEHPVKAALERQVETAVLGVSLIAQEQRAHHGRQGECHHRRHGDGHGDSNREFAEQPADDAAHQQQRDEHRHQRDADGKDREADLT